MRFINKKNNLSILELVFINFLLIGLVLYGFEFSLKPEEKRALPKNGVVDGTRYTWGHRVIINQYGFREREFETPKPADVYRVMVLGDSLTFGVGLSLDQRYTSIAEALLNKASLGVKFEVLNFGENGSPTVLERDHLNRFKDRVQPDLIVIGFCLNDPQQRSQNHSKERMRLLGTTSFGIVHNISLAFTSIYMPTLGGMFKDAYFSLAEQLGIIPSWQNALQRTYEKPSRQWKEFVGALEEIKQVSDDLKLEKPIFSILNQGVYPDKPTDYRNPDENLKYYLKWYHQAEETAKNIGIRTYNHESEIALQLNDEALGVNAVDGHPSANLNKIYGEKLYQAIAARFVSMNPKKSVQSSPKFISN